jgi:hypothetical protein
MRSVVSDLSDMALSITLFEDSRVAQVDLGPASRQEVLVIPGNKDHSQSC